MGIRNCCALGTRSAKPANTKEYREPKGQRTSVQALAWSPGQVPRHEAARPTTSQRPQDARVLRPGVSRSGAMAKAAVPKTNDQGNAKAPRQGEQGLSVALIDCGPYERDPWQGRRRTGDPGVGPGKSRGLWRALPLTSALP